MNVNKRLFNNYANMTFYINVRSTSYYLSNEGIFRGFSKFVYFVGWVAA
jgi:hypothetical protein